MQKHVTQGATEIANQILHVVVVAADTVVRHSQYNDVFDNLHDSAQAQYHHHQEDTVDARQRNVLDLEQAAHQQGGAEGVDEVHVGQHLHGALDDLGEELQLGLGARGALRLREPGHRGSTALEAT